jgi:hypothetical protein
MTVRNEKTGATAFHSGGARFRFCGAGFSLRKFVLAKDQTPRAEARAPRAIHFEMTQNPAAIFPGAYSKMFHLR